MFYRIYVFLVGILVGSLLNSAEIKWKSPTVFCNGLPNISAQHETMPYILSTDFLLWTANESGSDNWGMNFSTGSTQKSIDVLSVPFKWSPGLRCGVDYCLSLDGWDTKGVYTWFFTQGRNQASSTTGLSSPFLGNFYVNNADGSNIQASPQYAHASVKWSIVLNILDWELGRKYWISKALALRPFSGIKGGMIHQTIHTKWLHPLNVTQETAFLEGKEDLKNNFWGLGPIAGIDSMWKLGSAGKHVFSLFSDFSAAILWGRWAFEDVYQNDQPQKVSVDTSNFIGASSMLRVLWGLEWEAHFIPDRFSFFFRIGYESQFWLDQLQFYSYNTGRLSNPLTLQGVTFDLIFNF